MTLATFSKSSGNIVLGRVPLDERKTKRNYDERKQKQLHSRIELAKPKQHHLLNPLTTKEQNSI